LATLIDGIQLRDQHVSASACIPAHDLSHRIPLCLSLVSPPAAVPEQVFQHLGHYPGSAPTPKALVIRSMADMAHVMSSGYMPALGFIEPGSVRLDTCHRNRSLGHHLALEYLAAVLVAIGGLPLCLGCGPFLGDLRS
jgi:hypothetical protein